MESELTALSLSLFQSITVLTKYECLNFYGLKTLGIVDALKKI